MSNFDLPFLTPEENRRYRLAHSLGRYKFICGTGKVTNKEVADYYQAIWKKILTDAKKRL